MNESQEAIVRRLSIKRSTERTIVFLKIAVFSLFVVFLLVADKFDASLHVEGEGLRKDLHCINDYAFVYTEPAVRGLASYPWIRWALLVLSSWMIDITFIYSLIYWYALLIQRILDGDTARCIYAFAAFYFSRAIVQALFTFKFPQYTFWDWPGFPSLMVPYGKNSDFYPSGHTGFFMIMIRERWSQDRNKPIVGLLIGFLLVVVYVLIAFRQHYSIDILVALVYGYHMHFLVSPHSPMFDRQFSRLRLVAVTWWYKEGKSTAKPQTEIESKLR